MSDSKFEYIDDVLLNVDKDKIEKIEYEQLSAFLLWIKTFYSDDYYVLLRQDVRFIAAGRTFHYSRIYKQYSQVSLICRLRELSCSWRKLNSFFACGKQFLIDYFALIYNNVYALFSYCLCFVIYVLQQVYKSVSQHKSVQKLIKKCLIYLDWILKCSTFASAKQESWFLIDRFIIIGY